MITIEIRNSHELATLERALQTATDEVAKGEKVTFTLMLVIGVADVLQPSVRFTNAPPIDFHGYVGDKLTRAQKSQQLLSQLTTHFKLKMTELSLHTNIPRSGLYTLKEGRQAISEDRARKILTTFPCTISFREELLTVACTKPARKKRATKTSP